MKKLMIGNEAIARGLYEGGLSIVSSYPGTPSTEITEFLAKYDDVYSEWAPNEKVACEVAIGASMAGARSFCAMKHVGLNVAADPLPVFFVHGNHGGDVIVLAACCQPNRQILGIGGFAVFCTAGDEDYHVASSTVNLSPWRISSR